jgi:hypothetical protein
MAMKHPERGEDITPPKEATPVEVRRFSNEAKEALEEDGYIIITLTGQSIASLRQAGRRFCGYQDPQTQALTSMQSEVAFNPSQLFLPKSNNITLTQQEKMIERFSQRLAEKTPGVEAIMGGAADYIDLAFTHLDATGNRLFGEEYDYDWARTNTPHLSSAGYAVIVGCFSSKKEKGLDVNSFEGDRGAPFVFAAPLVVPKA